MRIAIPVKDDNVIFFPNAGHTPKFAIYEMAGSGMFRSFTLVSVVNNPRTDLEHDDHDDEHHTCSHGHDDAEHIAQHNKMGVALDGCKFLVVKKACKNIANTMSAHGINLVKYQGNALESTAILKDIAAKL